MIPIKLFSDISGIKSTGNTQGYYMSACKYNYITDANMLILCDFCDLRNSVGSKQGAFFAC